jgi:hypothetical protein
MASSAVNGKNFYLRFKKRSRDVVIYTTPSGIKYEHTYSKTFWTAVWNSGANFDDEVTRRKRRNGKITALVPEGVAEEEDEEEEEDDEVVVVEEEETKRP